MNALKSVARTQRVNSSNNGYTCEYNLPHFVISDFDECASIPCLDGGTCTDGANEFICECEPPRIGVYCERGKVKFSNHECLFMANIHYIALFPICQKLHFVFVKVFN